jgi:hypothetical protein
MEINKSNVEQIPENMSLGKVPIKVIKQQNLKPQQTQIQQTQIQQTQTIKPALSGAKARMVRPQTLTPKPKVSYDDILAKMGMFVADGKLHLLDGKPKEQVQQIQKQQIQKQSYLEKEQFLRDYPKQPTLTSENVYKEPLVQQNSYIYNKYFRNEPNAEQGVRVPQTLQEYRNMLIQDIIQKQRIKQVKSTKLMMPNSNINFARNSGNLNKLFSFSQR